MELYLRPARRRDVAVCAALYNADPAFLLHHLGRDKVDEGFVEEELEEMDRAGFARLLIAETPGGPPVALADLRGGEEAYLSLLLVDKAAQGRGLGRRGAALLEQRLRAEGSRRIRIDVVDDHAGNPLPFWHRLGYRGNERVTLTWGDKTSSALVLRKEL